MPAAPDAPTAVMPAPPSTSGADHASSLPRRAVSQVLSPRAWKRIVYLLLALPLGTLWFSLIVALVSTGVPAVITIIGIPILILTLYGLRWAANLERWLLRGLDVADVARPYRAPAKAGWWPSIRTRVNDPATWKDLVYLLVEFPLGILTFTIVTTLITTTLSLITAPVWVWATPESRDLGFLPVDSLPLAIGATVLGLALVVPVMWLLDKLGGIYGAWARVMLTTEANPVLEARVDEMRTSQARMVAAADTERRRIERNLHDGAQQRLVALGLKLGLAERKLEQGDPGAGELVRDAHSELEAALAELRDIARGIHPAILDRGLPAALADLARRSSVPVELAAVPDGPIAETEAATAYYVVAESLANVEKYAQASTVTVRVEHRAGVLDIDVADDGVGGADAAKGSGLRGLADRLGALDGRLDVASLPGQGTRVHATLPCL